MNAAPAQQTAGISAEQFRMAMAALPAPVTVVACYDDSGAVRGMTASAVASLSADPPLLLVCVDRRASTHDALVSSPWFSVSLLAPGQEELARRFSGPAERRCTGTEIEYHRAPVLGAASPGFICARHGLREGGDHTILLGRIIQVTGEAADDPGGLVWHRRAFHHLRPAADS